MLYKNYVISTNTTYMYRCREFWLRQSAHKDVVNREDYYTRPKNVKIATESGSATQTTQLQLIRLPLKR